MLDQLRERSKVAGAESLFIAESDRPRMDFSKFQASYEEFANSK